MEATEKRENGDRILTGLDWFDKITGGGAPAGTVSVILGDPGSGKTTLARMLELAAQPSLGAPAASIVNLIRGIVHNADKDVRFFWIDCEDTPSTYVIDIARGVALQKRAFSVVFAPSISDAVRHASDAIFQIRRHNRVWQMCGRKSRYSDVLSNWIDILTECDQASPVAAFSSQTPSRRT